MRSRNGTPLTLSLHYVETGDYDVYLNGSRTTCPARPSPTTRAACAYWDQAEKALYSDVDLAPISNRFYFSYLKNAQAGISGYSIPTPTSIRVLR